MRIFIETKRNSLGWRGWYENFFWHLVGENDIRQRDSGNLLSTLCYTIMVVNGAYILLDEKKSILNIIREIFPIHISILFSIYLFGNSTAGSYLNLAGFSLFLVLNKKNLADVFKKGKVIFLNQRIIDRD